MNSSNALWHHQQVAILLIVVAVAVLLVVFFWHGAKKAERADESPEAILKSRYAKGELDDETYQRMLAELRR